MKGFKDEIEKIVISASRRTDIPAFYMDWFMERIERGSFTVPNPVSGQMMTVAATADKVHTIVFWSKNFGPFLAARYGQELIRRGFNLFFQFTINSEDRLLEPAIPPLDERLRQAQDLSREFGPQVIAWRFDPICFYQHEPGEKVCDNLQDFDRIAQALSRLGIRRCITSFMDDYGKIRRRIRSRPGFKFIYPGIEEQIKILLEMEKKLAALSLDLYTCCEEELVSLLPSDSRIRPSSCIPNDFFQKLFGGRLCLQIDYGQRHAQGCRCKLSRDIGSYHLQPCRHNCLYCYANPDGG
ncbi:MAG: DUF1848 domain-containing protein [bacterium]|nr:DUF1848 domain-containing protein [bacterium]